MSTQVTFTFASNVTIADQEKTLEALRQVANSMTVSSTDAPAPLAVGGTAKAYTYRGNRTVVTPRV